MRRNRTIVDDAAALGHLSSHHPKASWVQRKGPLRLVWNNPLPLLIGHVLKFSGGNTNSGILEQNVQSTKCLFRLGKQISNRSGIGHIGGNSQRIGLVCLSQSQSFIERFFSSAGKDDLITGPRRAITTARPIPLPAPVTNATLSKLGITKLILNWAGSPGKFLLRPPMQSKGLCAGRNRRQSLCPVP